MSTYIGKDPCLPLVFDPYIKSDLNAVVKLGLVNSLMDPNSGRWDVDAVKDFSMMMRKKLFSAFHLVQAVGNTRGTGGGLIKGRIWLRVGIVVLLDIRVLVL